MGRKDFKKHNDFFSCVKCGTHNPSLQGGERNHCRKCLFSLHVDFDTPGDRNSDCNGLMEPVGLDHKGGKGFMIKHKCVECGKKILNRAAEDDELLSSSRT